MGKAIRVIKFSFLATIISFLLGSGPVVAGGASIDEEISKTLESNRNSLIELRRDLHRHPELSGQEERTAGIVGKYLREIGLEVRSGVGGYGVIGILTGGKPGPAVAYRADMDAVVSTAPDPVPFASETEGVRHICGHDMHTTIALGIATAMAKVRSEVEGTIIFFFQPAEENAEGARAMIADGALNEPRPDAIFALHCAPLEVGQMCTKEGMLLPGLDVIQVTFSGKGDLASAAAKCSQIVSGISEMGTPNQFITASIFESKDLTDEGKWSLTGMVRASSEEKHREAKKKIEEGLASIDLPDISYELDYTLHAIPPVMNEPVMVQRANQVLGDVIGKDAVIPIDEVTPFFSEDFAFFQQEMPGVMFFLGVSNQEKGILGMPHNPMFAADEDAILIGAKAMSMVLLDYLSTH
jgi:metal-dependent amidase/aminoacylase/carboxypeptidase family protein